MLKLRLFGGASLEDATGVPVARVVQRRRLTLLAILALEHPRPVSRDRLIAWLWPEHDTERARHLLRDSLYLLRSTLGDDVVERAGDELRLATQCVRCDVGEFEEALSQERWEDAVSTYAGPLLDGFFAGGAAELEHWLDTRRDRLARAYAKALEQLAERASASADRETAVEWWRRLAAVEPHNGRVTLHLMQALEAAGDRAGALRQARTHAVLLEQEFGAAPDPEVEALAERLRTTPPERTAPSSLPDVHQDAATLTGRADRAGLQPPAAPLTRPEVGAPLAVTPDVATLDGPTRDPAPQPAPIHQARRQRLDRAVVLPVAAVTVLLAVLAAVLVLTETSAQPPAAPPGGTEGLKAIAVLPCANLSRDPEQEYFSDGLTEELTGVLAQVHSLRVVARTSAFAFKGENRDVRDVADRLGVGTILECSVRRAGDRVRVTAQLIDAATGYHLWAESYDREGTDVFAIQADLALHIATALATELTPDERARLRRRPTASPAAHALYQKGRYFWNQRTRSGYARAIDYYERALEADPRYAEAYAGLATVYSMLGIFGNLTPGQASELTKQYALKALALDPDVAEAHTVMGGYYQAHAWDSEAAEREHRRALELDPSYSTAHFWYGNYLTAMKRYDEAIAHKRKSVELEPLSPQLSWSLGFTLVAAGRADEAVEQFRNAIELDSMYYPAYAGLGDAYAASGRPADAVAALERAVALSGRDTDTRARLARNLAVLGRRDEARRILGELEAEAARTGVYAPWVAPVFFALGESDGAMAWLERSYRQRHPVLRFIGGPGFTELEADPRFRDLRRRIGLPE